MNSVERVKAICQEKHIPIARLERECGFSNGYIKQLRRGTFPYERLIDVSNYLGVSPEYIAYGEAEKKTAAPEGNGLTETQRNLIDIVNRLTETEAAALLAAARSLEAGRKDQDS